MGTKSAWVSRKVYQARIEVLREKLIQMQVQLHHVPFKVLLILAGPEGAGRGELLHTLAEWLDPRGLETFSYHEPTDEERRRPLQWRFWRSLPAHGRIGLYAGSWYTETLRDEARGKRKANLIRHEAGRIAHFEKLLVDDGTLIIKVWLDLSKAAQGERLRALRADPDTAWRATDEDWHHHRIYDRLAKQARLIRRLTDRPGARWTTIDAEHERVRDLAVGELLLDQFQRHQKKMAKLSRAAAPKSVRPLRISALRQLRRMPLDQELSANDYASGRDKWLGRLNYAIRAAIAKKRSLIFVFEGWDAAGKGGAIRRLVSAMDPGDYAVIPVIKPTLEEKQAHYLWRFWRNVPRDGRIAIFDRSWYGRVLVERIEGFCREDEWRRAYREINEFEHELTEHGAIILKFWMHISHEEQLRRFRDRETTAHKRHKINDEDWRNRRKRAAYETAVGDMLALTNRDSAPWHLISAENKRHGRMVILRTAARQIEQALDL
ncbi:MAG TPA: polyphosphate:AMP phosphotransferase [Candidatus Didemnitutus sp.]|nr:polyphosphate:AMP phosphotransferase [Candidatus Didemnitutus sp.]